MTAAVESAWSALFADAGNVLGRCGNCNLHYVAKVPAQAARTSEIEVGRFGGSSEVLSAQRQKLAESSHRAEYHCLVSWLDALAGPGPWLDVGCGAGTLLVIAREQGVPAEGIELNVERRRVAERLTGTTIYAEPLEALRLPSAKYSAVTMINVFSHLTSPSLTLAEVRRVLRPGGILHLVTGEIGSGVRRRHGFDWALGDHLFFLGEGTIEGYGRRIGFELLERSSVWFPEVVYSRERLATAGRSTARNLAKAAITRLPWALDALQMWIRMRHRENPIYSSALTLRKRGSDLAHGSDEEDQIDITRSGRGSVETSN